jgi:hypothetical protein
MGGYHLINNDRGFRLTADLEYDLDIRSYNNDYNYVDSSGNLQVSSGFSGLRTGDAVFAETSENAHNILPSIAGQWSGDNLNLRFRLNLNVPIENESVTTMTFRSGSTDGSLVQTGPEWSSTSIGFRPDLRLAAQWRIVPKLALNLGGQLNLRLVERVTTEGATFNAEGNEMDHTAFKRVESLRPTAIVNNLGMGVTFNATDNLTFEVTSGARDGTVSVFGTGDGGLLHFTNLLLSLRF